MGKKKKKQNIIKFDSGESYGERELAQILRRKMITRESKNLKKYTRKLKHKSKLNQS